MSVTNELQALVQKMNPPPRRPVLIRSLLALAVLGMAEVSSTELEPMPQPRRPSEPFGHPIPSFPGQRPYVPPAPPPADSARLAAAEDKRARRAAKRLKERR